MWKPSSTLIDSVKEAQVGAVVAPNFSMGVNLFARVLREAARTFSAMPDLQPLLYEIHHRGKKDSPSGTARHLARLLLEHSTTVDRWVEGAPDAQLPPGAMQVSGLRSGSEPGTHVVRFEGSCESITMEHRARNRDGFARGAIVAAEWLVGRSGWFSFEDVMDSVLRGELPPWEAA
jgi:4-hydroxy-tetrahydrodipicolinate reductase